MFSHLVPLSPLCFDEYFRDLGHTSSHSSILSFWTRDTGLAPESCSEMCLLFTFLLDQVQFSLLLATHLSILCFSILAVAQFHLRSVFFFPPCICILADQSQKEESGKGSLILVSNWKFQIIFKYGQCFEILSCLWQVLIDV